MVHPALFLICMIVWIWLVGFVLRRTATDGQGSIGLPTAFLFSMTFMYGGAFIYALPGYSHLRADVHWYLLTFDFTEATVFSGLLVTLLGLFGFAIGCGVFKPRRNALAEIPRPRLSIDPAFRRQLLRLIAGIAVFGLALHAARINFPMSSVILQVTRNMAVVLVCLGAALVVLADGRHRYGRWIAMAGVLPLYFLVVWGFVSYGFIVFTIYASFWLTVLRPPGIPRWRVILIGTAILYALLILFVAWMSFRAEIREVVWEGGGLGDSSAVLGSAVTGIELLTPNNFDAMDWINIRLNQTMLVGKVVEWHDQHPDLRLHGSTLFVIVLAWVPRFLWPGKPTMGGSQFMSDHTGRYFSESSTFGSGPVIEFYANFGYVGVFVGFIVLGFCLRWIDKRASVALRKGDLFNFLLWFTVGIAFIAPSSLQFFVAASAIMGYLMLIAMRMFMLSRRRIRPRVI